MASVTFKDIDKRFGSTAALDAVSLEVETGAFCALVGPSGCGKTTLLRVAAGFLRADRGEVCFDGAPAGALPPNRRDLGFVFQSYALFPTKTVGENIGFSLRLRRRPRAEIAERVAHFCRLMHLEGLEARYPHELSGGQQQRVALARALVSEPSVLLLDEPLSALDAKTRALLRVEIRRIVETLGVTAIYVTHDQEEALSISDRVAIMNRGRLLQVGTPLEVYLNPADRFVAEFIGTTNSLPCTLLDDSNVRLGEVAVAVRNGRPGRPDGQATLSVRPEHVDLLPAGNGGVPAVLRGVSFLGQSVRLTMTTLDDRALLADVPTVEWLERSLEPGAPLAWRVRAGLASVFPGGAESGDPDEAAR